MGGGSYSTSARSVRATSLGYHTKSLREVYDKKKIQNGMNPNGVTMRESRDSIEHPNSLAIIIALDLTGSMGSVPAHLVKDGLPHIMESIIKAGTEHPQLLFVGVGDHECDDSPLQVGQFESSDALLDKWLTDIYLEGGGGGNTGESYHLAWYFAGYHTSIDCFEKRQQKGFLFTIGDEPCLESLDKAALKIIMGDGQYKNHTAQSLLEKAREKYEVFHINVSETGAGSRPETHNKWRDLIGSANFLMAQRSSDIPDMIANTINNRVSITSTPISITSVM
jgi:hypothetical protein